MATKAETKIVQDILEHLKTRLGGDGFHVHGGALQRGGEPDLTGEVYLPSCGWIHFKIEVKVSHSEVPSPRQLYRLGEYWKRGYLVGIVTSVSEFHDLVYGYDAYRAQNPYKDHWYYITDLIRTDYPEIYNGTHKYCTVETPTTNGRLRKG